MLCNSSDKIHTFKAMHHLGPDDDRHWCPTGYLQCKDCGDIARIDHAEAAKLCNLWNAFKPGTEPLNGPGRDDTPWLDSFGNVALPDWK